MEKIRNLGGSSGEFSGGFSGESSGESVLVALDKWITERFRKTYTNDDFKKLAKGTLETIGKFEPDSMDEAREYVFDSLSLESLTDIMSSSFSRGFSNLEQEISREECLGVDISNMPKEIMENYINPYLKFYNTLKIMIDDLRTKFDEKFPEELSKKDIDDSARKIFPKNIEIADFFDNMNQALLLIKYFQAEIGDASKREQFISKEVYKKIKNPVRDIYRRMFADLYEDTGDKKLK